MAEVKMTRADHQELVDKLKGIATVQFYPVVKWGSFTYIVLEQPALRVAVQTIDVIDITGENVMRLAPTWPQTAYDPTHALVIHPYEGWPAVVVMADKSEWQAYIASLPVQVVPPTQENAQAALEAVTEYDTAMVDAGAPLQIR